jgi:hypothetical protein
MMHLDHDTWRITDLTRPGRRISADTIAELVGTISSSAPNVDWDSATVILQLFDNSVYMVGGMEGEKSLPAKDRNGTYHIDSSLVVADKPAVKGLVNLTVPLLKCLGNSRKLFLTPLTRYWVTPCCNNPQHHINYCLPGYLPRLGEAIHQLRDSIRDSLFTKRVPNFRVLCPNRMVGIGQRQEEPSDEEAAATVALWGAHPVHPTGAAYRVKELANGEAKYTNPPKQSFGLGCPAKLVSFRYNRNRNRKKFRNYAKQKDLFQFFRTIPKLERFGSFGCFGLIKKNRKNRREREGEGKWTGNGREMERKWKGNIRERESEGISKSKERGMRREM